MGSVILKIAIFLIITALAIQATHIPLDHNSPISGIFLNADIISALSIIQYIFAISSIFLIVKFIISKIFPKK
ncbi:MAG TPA: hypothetical protein VFG24_07800 [Nitrosopumilaceae archaeon]|nr:hypothetical protein [Nitrosopumilaceae archaeon]